VASSLDQPRDASPQPPMYNWLDAVEDLPQTQRGDLVEGVVMGVDNDGILVNIGGKAEGVIPFQEARSLTPEDLRALQPGQTLWVYVLRPETPNTPALLSLDRARRERGWQVLYSALANGTPVEGRITGVNRGGLVVEVEGVQAFVPLSQVARRGRAAPSREALEKRVGQTVRLKVLEVDRRRNRAVLSERQIWEEEQERLRSEALARLQEGQVVRGRVTGIAPFGAFVDLGAVEGLIPLSELSWRPVQAPEEVVQVGQEVEVQVIRLDREGGRVSLSLRRLQPSPWDAVPTRYPVGTVVEGTVTRLAPYGAFVRLEEGVEGLVHISELSHRLIRHPKEVVKEGDVVRVKVLRVEPERRRLGLSIKRALDEA